MSCLKTKTGWGSYWSCNLLVSQSLFISLFCSLLYITATFSAFLCLQVFSYFKICFSFCNHWYIHLHPFKIVFLLHVLIPFELSLAYGFSGSCGVCLALLFGSEGHIPAYVFLGPYLLSLLSAVNLVKSMPRVKHSSAVFPAG